jgi:hypothetical protein
MTSAVKHLIESFDALSADEQREATRLLLARVVAGESGDVADDALVAAAEELFADLDRREAASEAG